MKHPFTRGFRAKPLDALQHVVALIGLIACAWLAWSNLPKTVHYRLQCAFTGLTPREELIHDPVLIGTEWTYVNIPSSLQRVPYPEAFEINANHIAHTLSDDLQGPVPKDLSIPKGFKHIKTNQVVLFSVKVQDAQGHEVRLFQHTIGVNHGLDPPLPFLKFGLANQHWRKAYFAPDVQLNRVAIRASSPITIERLAWTPSGYCKWPNRTWDSINPESLYHFEGPSPASDALRNP